MVHRIVTIYDGLSVFFGQCILSKYSAKDKRIGTLLMLLFLSGNSILLCWLEQREKSEVRQTVFRLKISLLGLQDLWKGLFVAREVRGWCHECQFLHHEGRRVSSKSPEWCKNWHEWHHPLTSSATKSPFQRSRRPKRNWFSAEKQFAATEDFSRCSNQHDRMFFHIG